MFKFATTYLYMYYLTVDKVVTYINITYFNIEVEEDNCSICQDYLGQYNAIKGDSDVQHSTLARTAIEETQKPHHSLIIHLIKRLLW